jgi:hypothetical protein
MGPFGWIQVKCIPDTRALIAEDISHTVTSPGTHTITVSHLRITESASRLG